MKELSADATGEFDVLKTLDASFKSIKFPSDNYQTDLSEITTLLSLLLTTKFSSQRQLKNLIELFSLFWIKAVKAK